MNQFAIGIACNCVEKIDLAHTYPDVVDFSCHIDFL